jgi:hypothetical protein
MEKRVYNCIIIGIVLFLLVILVKNNELFTSSDIPVNNLNNLQQITDILERNKDDLLKLEKDFDNQQVELDKYIKQNNELITEITKQKELHQNLMNRNDNLAKQVMTNISNLARKRGIKNVQQVVEDLLK